MPEDQSRMDTTGSPIDSLTAPTNRADREQLLAKWQEFLATGGFFNPELMNADGLRDLALDTRDYLKAADALPLAPPAWQPMATAPKDGTRIVVVSTWNPYASGVIQWVESHWLDWNDRMIPTECVTHWIPLSAPPLAVPQEPAHDHDDQARVVREGGL